MISFKFSCFIFLANYIHSQKNYIFLQKIILFELSVERCLKIPLFSTFWHFLLLFCTETGLLKCGQENFEIQKKLVYDWETDLFP